MQAKYLIMEGQLGIQINKYFYNSNNQVMTYREDEYMIWGRDMQQNGMAD